MEAPCQDLAWQISGEGGITADDVILIGLIHVGAGSGPNEGMTEMWQPILQLDRYIIP